MLATESNSSQQSLLRRSSSIWRRFSRRSSSPPETPSTPPPPNRQQQPQPHQNKLQKRNHLIAHMMHRVDAPQRTERRRPPPAKPAAQSRVLASHMTTTPFPKDSNNVHTVSWNVFVTPEQVHKLFMGFKPEQMEDKWFVYSEGPDRAGKLKVHFFRSWTGIKIAELFVVIDLKGEGAGKIVGIKWNASDETNAMDEEEAKYMISTTCAWVLKVDLDKQGGS